MATVRLSEEATNLVEPEGWAAGPYIFEPHNLFGMALDGEDEFPFGYISADIGEPLFALHPVHNLTVPQLVATAHLLKASPALYLAASDALAGWRYIRANHGDLYGVGWDRVEQALTAALSSARGEQGK